LVKMAQAGANRIGASASVAIVTEGEGSIAGKGPRDSLARGNPRGVTGATDDKTRAKGY